MCVRGKRQREHVPHRAPLLLCRADICKLQGWRCLKALITPPLRADVPSHWRLVLLMLSRVKHGGAVHNPLCCWFKVGWSRNNGHEKNMATHFHYFRSPKWCSGEVGVQDGRKHLHVSNMSPRQSASITVGKHGTISKKKKENPMKAAFGAVEQAAEANILC